MSVNFNMQSDNMVIINKTLYNNIHLYYTMLSNKIQSFKNLV